MEKRIDKLKNDIDRIDNIIKILLIINLSLAVFIILCIICNFASGLIKPLCFLFLSLVIVLINFRVNLLEKESLYANCYIVIKLLEYINKGGNKK